MLLDFIPSFALLSKVQWKICNDTQIHMGTFYILCIALKFVRPTLNFLGCLQLHQLHCISLIFWIWFKSCVPLVLRIDIRGIISACHIHIFRLFNCCSAICLSLTTFLFKYFLDDISHNFVCYHQNWCWSTNPHILLSTPPLSDNSFVLIPSSWGHPMCNAGS